MDNLIQLTSSDLEMRINPQDVRISQIIAGALLSGVLIFCLIVIFLYSRIDPAEIPPEITQNSPVPIFSLVLIGLTIMVYFLAFNILRLIHSPGKLQSILSQPIAGTGGSISDPVQKLVALNRIRMIIKMAMLEGVALFGTVALFIAVQDGTIYADGKYWGLLIPAIFFFLFTYSNFPTKRRMIEQIEEELIKPLRSAS